ncbi:hypothetical protein AIOL_002785 [Candidatus Rhodobacter oscarellae]|uniref:Copper metallochaperone n=1 Tax=Candidatus Rhodobacter oscarellae TaxID=1675527 RepID=A0A0J9E505_9RHOB|nr:copper chaperone PCu(A)C [Candidatus Rhodobacter lobularis]KMW57817.1 hypothetical protein AIOL_002785 [Candidatus Rhodobacter lobularis]
MRLTVLAAFLLSTAAAPVLAADDEHSDHLSEADGLRILHAWTNATDDDHVAVYLEIENNRATEVVLMGAETEIAKEAHLMAIDPSTGDETEIEELPVPAGSEMELAPGGLFIELHDVAKALSEGDEFELELEFGDDLHLDVHVEVEAADADSHGHAGHNH